ncbi:MAG: GNAT family N-acetyltransferase [Planctomycetes bacterium]|nr:GNAT family N-acetyltransferase [Planctomycetota bacterium]
MDLQIREGTPEDAATIAGFNTAIAMETERLRLDPATAAAGVRTLLGRPELGRYMVAEADGQLVGQLMITYEWSDWRNGLCWWIQSVYVRPDWRRHGVFRALYRHVEQLAQATPGVRGIRLYVEQANERAMAAYRDLGMRPSGHVVYEVDWAPQHP